MRIGIIGEKSNFISYSMLSNALRCENIKIVWFINAETEKKIRDGLYGKPFDYGLVINLFKKISLKKNGGYDCRKLCKARGIPFITPEKNNLNTGLPDEMYARPEGEYALIAGCDQILDSNGLKLAKNKIINYHYSLLPSYRGKFAAFWQWYNREPYLGFSFHEVELGIDTGPIIFQEKFEYVADEPFSVTYNRLISRSSESLCRLFSYLADSKRKIINENLEDSYNSARKYFELITVDESKTVKEVVGVFGRTGFLRLKNGLMTDRIVMYGNETVGQSSIDAEGITLPLSDGFVKVQFSRGTKRILYRCLTGEKRLLKGL